MLLFFVYSVFVEYPFQTILIIGGGLLTITTILYAFIEWKKPHLVHIVKIIYAFDALVIAGLIALAWVWVGESREMHRSFEVRETGNISDCEDLLPPKNSVDEGNVARCFQSLAEHYKDASYCDNITGAVTDWGEVMFAASRDMCNETIAYTTLDIDVCDKVSNPERCKGIVLSKIEYQESQSSSEESSESSSTTEVSGDPAPFDACLGLNAYTNEEWYPKLEALETKLAGAINLSKIIEACLSSERLIMIQEAGKETVIWAYVPKYDVLYMAGDHLNSETAITATSFGKRTGNDIPLLRGNCTVGTLHIKEHGATIERTCFEQEPECVNPPTPTAIGRDVYPIFPEYKHLEFLGQIFTASLCGKDRFEEIFGKDKRYTWGSGLQLSEEPQGHFKTLLEATGYECSPDHGCKEQNLFEPTFATIFLQLMRFSDKIISDDCRNCG